MAKGTKAIRNPKSKTQNRKVSAARAAAFEILLKISREKAFSSVLLPLYEEKLEAKDRRLCHELVLGVLRRRLFLDRIVEELTKKKPEKLDAEVLESLRLGLYQLISLDRIPVYSAINESVNLVYRARKNSAAGLVNAVLRRAAREKTFNFTYSEETERVSVETSHPRPLVERWMRQFGPERAEKLAQANNRAGAVAFRLTGKSNEKTVETLKKIDLEISKSEISRSGWRVVSPNEMLFAFARDGKIYFQEESSQLVAETLDLQPNEKFLDICAAPGGKTTLAAFLQRQTEDERQEAEGGRRKAEGANLKLAEDMEPDDLVSEDFELENIEPETVAQRAAFDVPTPESEIRNPKSEIRNLLVAGDLHEHRLRTLRESCRRTGEENVRIVAYDAEKALPFADESFDCILLDAPCSGTGTIRHNPEIRYFISEPDFFVLHEKQLRILENASKLLKKGGRLVYSTCSLEREENEAVVAEFLRGRSDFRQTAAGLPEKFLTAEGFARTFPERDDTDGFFIARLEKV